MAWSLRLVEHRLESGAIRSFSKGSRVLFVRAGTIRLVTPGHAEGGASVGREAAVFAAGACGVQSYRDALSFLAFELVRQPPPPAGGRVLLEHPIALDPKAAWLMRCDRVDFAPGMVAPRHGHRGGGIRCLMRPGDCWFESGREPVLAQASTTEETSFVRCAILPAQIRGTTSILYVDPADATRGRPRTYTVFVDEPITP